MRPRANTLTAWLGSGASGRVSSQKARSRLAAPPAAVARAGAQVGQGVKSSASGRRRRGRGLGPGLATQRGFGRRGALDRWRPCRRRPARARTVPPCSVIARPAHSAEMSLSKRLLIL
jgi:hypothetical protein